MKIKGYLLGAIASVMLIVTLFTGIGASALAGYDYDYTRPASPHGRELDSAEVLERYLGSPLSREERDYISAYGSLRVSYDVGVTTSRVVTAYDNGRLDFFVLDYTYLTSDGVEVTWIPVSVSVGGQSTALVMEGGHYVASFDGVAEEDGLLSYIEYRLDVKLSAIDMASIVNMAYADAPAIAEDIQKRTEEYERLCRQYEADLISYEEYMRAAAEYERKYAVYLDYLSNKKLYDDALAEYNAYLAAEEQYSRDKLAFLEYCRLVEEYNRAYAVYSEYLKLMEEYNEKREEYLAYSRELETVRAQLAVIEAVKTPMTDNRDVYSAIMGSLVDTVIDNKDLIASSLVGASEQVIDDAGESTEKLRTMLSYYFSLDSEEDKYVYYTSNYEQLRDNFALLLKTLDELYRNRRVRGELISQGRDKKYIILVAQLAIIANALSEETVYSYYGDYAFDSSYRIEKKSISQILENKTYFSDTGSPLPLAGGFPAEVKEPQSPEEVKEPVRPTAVKEPTPPTSVAHPGTPPATVEEPLRPDTVEDPGTPPAPYIPDPVLVKLVDAYNSGKLSERPAPTEDYILTLSHTLTKQVFGASSVTVEFRSADGLPLYVCSVDRGTAADYVGPVPTKSEDVSATYSFDGWVTADGVEVDLAFVESDLILYPSFKPTIKNYSVTFTVCGESTAFLFPYGSLPEYPKTPTRPTDNRCSYAFIGWDKPLEAVSGDCEYVAQFEEIWHLPFVGGGGAVLYYDGSTIIADCMSSSSNIFDLKRVIALATDGAGNYSLCLKTRAAELILPYSVLLSMRANLDTVLVPSVVQGGVSGFTYRVGVFNESGDVSVNSYRISATFPSLLADEAAARIFYLEDGERVYSSYEYSDGLVSFGFNTAFTYRLVSEYSVSLIPSDMVGVTVSAQVSRPDEWIYVDVSVPRGVVLDRVYLVYPDGTQHEVREGRFKMPACDVTVAVSARYLEYKITFMNLDKVIVVRKYRYGDTVIPPQDPTRVSDSTYSYTFVRWTPEITAVTGDAVYKAKYELHLLPPKVDPPGLQISEGVMTLIIAAAVGVGMLTLVVIPSAVIAGVSWHRARRKYTGKRR